MYLAYFLAGRSPASRSRTIEVQASSDIQVKDTSGSAHDRLRHYVAAVRRGGWTVVGNGEQVEPLANALSAGIAPGAAWTAYTYEPDPPIFTPRIWLAVQHSDGALLAGSAARSECPDGSPDRLLWMAEALPVVAGVLLTTYVVTAKAVVTSGPPVGVTTTAASGDELLDQVWASLDPAPAVAAFVASAEDLSATLLVAP